MPFSRTDFACAPAYGRIDLTMPNAQTHIAAVCDLLARAPVQSALPWLADDAARAAFLLGAISPDVRIQSGQSRETTHFFAIPPADLRPASVAMVEAWPALHDASSLSQPHAAFVAGYMTHLIMDQTWVEKIVMPGLFIQGIPWGTHHPNWWRYSLLMTYLEYAAAQHVPGGAVAQMQRAEPHGWLPFVADRYLVEWRDHVAERIEHGGARLISTMFARSNGIAPEALEAVVLDEGRMNAEVFNVVSHGQLEAFQQETARRSEAAVLAYLQGGLPAYEEAA